MWRLICGFDSPLNGGPPVKYRKNWARRFTNLRALEALKKENPGVKLQLDVDKKAEFGIIVGIWDALTSVGIDAGEVPARIEINKPGAR